MPDLCSREGKPVGQDDRLSDQFQQFDSMSTLPKSLHGTTLFPSFYSSESTLQDEPTSQDEPTLPTSSCGWKTG